MAGLTREQRAERDAQKAEAERSGAGMKADQAAAMGLSSGDPRDPNKGARPPRVPMNQGLNLDTAGLKLDKENYHYYWFKDDPAKPGRITRAKAAYWEHVTDEQGQPYTRPSGSGVHYLMRLPIEYYREDQQLKRKKVAATMEAEAKLGDNEYAPDPISKRAEGGRSAIQERSSSGNPYS